ncbi:hypothetical protein GCM10009124_24670 [Shewanella xiamenensis]|nr:hypothetical protein GCM10009124_24670 [Shewanella xiamenensis]
MLVALAGAIFGFAGFAGFATSGLGVLGLLRFPVGDIAGLAAILTTGLDIMMVQQERANPKIDP